MINMGELERAISMSRQGERQFPVHRLMWVSSPCSCPFARLLVAGTTLHRSNEGFVTGNGDESFAPAVVDQFAVHLCFAFLFVSLVVVLDELIHRGDPLRWKPRTAIATVLHAWQETDISTAKLLRGFSVASQPETDGARWSGRSLQLVALK